MVEEVDGIVVYLHMDHDHIVVVYMVILHNQRFEVVCLPPSQVLGNRRSLLVDKVVWFDTAAQAHMEYMVHSSALELLAQVVVEAVVEVVAEEEVGHVNMDHILVGLHHNEFDLFLRVLLTWEPVVAVMLQWA